VPRSPAWHWPRSRTGTELRGASPSARIGRVASARSCPLFQAPRHEWSLAVQPWNPSAGHRGTISLRIAAARIGISRSAGALRRLHADELNPFGPQTHRHAAQRTHEAAGSTAQTHEVSRRKPYEGRTELQVQVFGYVQTQLFSPPFPVRASFGTDLRGPCGSWYFGSRSPRCLILLDTFGQRV